MILLLVLIDYRFLMVKQKEPPMKNGGSYKCKKFTVARYGKVVFIPPYHIISTYSFHKA